MPTTVEFDPDEGGIRELFSPAGEVGRYFSALGNRIAADARSNAPVDSGELRGSIRVEQMLTNTEIKTWVYSDLDYSIYVHEGTGIYGPSGSPIRPRRSRFLVFPGRGGGRNGNLIFARQVRGQRPQRYLLDALKNVSPWPVDETVIYT